MEAEGALPGRAPTSTAEARLDQAQAVKLPFAHPRRRIGALDPPTSPEPLIRPVPAEELQHARRADRVRAARRPDAALRPAMLGTTGAGEFTIPVIGEEADGTIIATGATVVGTVASG